MDEAICALSRNMGKMLGELSRREAVGGRISGHYQMGDPQSTEEQLV